MLVSRYYIKDIKEYEDINRKSLLDNFKDMTIDGLIELIKLGNRNCDDDTAYKILDDYLSEDKGLEDAYIEIKECLFGDSEDVEDGSGYSIENYKDMTEIYSEMCSDLMGVGVSYGEFWDMTTTDIQRAFNSLVSKLERDINRDLVNSHTLAAMIATAFAGKLPKEPPEIEIKKRGDDIISTAYGDMDRDSYEMMLTLQNIKDRHNRRFKKEGKHG